MKASQTQGSKLHTTDGNEVGIVELCFGDTVMQSGIYRVIHLDQQKVPDMTVVAIRGERVERCGRCGEEVRLRLVRSAPHISEDGDLCGNRPTD